VANQVAARLQGDDFQHLYAWWNALGLYLPRLHLAEVWIEDERAGSFDDVTLHHTEASGRASHFVQVKYHVDQRRAYSTEVLLERTGGGSSLLQKFYRTWQKLRTSGKEPQLTLYSNWSWDSNDKIGECISGENGRLTEQFLTASAGSDIGKLRAQWITECGAAEEDFAAFVRTLRFLLGSSNAQEQVTALTIERMEHLGLRHDESALILACGTVRDWIKRGVQKLTRANFDKVIADLGLRAQQHEPAVTVYLDTIKSRRLDLAPDYHLDWREHFCGPEFERGHTPIDPTIWNRELLPQLQALEVQINQEHAPRIIRARGLSRLSAWFAFGKVFSRVAGYDIEVRQGAALWRSDAVPSTDFTLIATRSPAAGARAAQLAVGLSITGSLANDMERYLQSIGFAGAVLLLHPARGPSRDVFRDGSDVVAFVQEAKRAIREAIHDTGAGEVLLFYFGPLSGACFLGHDLNALGANVIVYEDQQPGYAPSFRLGK
jgi:hypothetical protein